MSGSVPPATVDAPVGDTPRPAAEGEPATPPAPDEPGEVSAPPAAIAPATPAVPAPVPAADGLVQIPTCANCGSPVPDRYCGSCGQRLEPHIHSIWHFAAEAAEAVTHADSRLWQTLRTLLFRPGRLTREFLDGRRSSQLPPFRLYLVISVLFFLIASLLSDGPGVNVGAGDPAVSQAMEEARRDIEAERARRGETRSERAAAQPEEKPPEERCDFVSYDGPWRATIQPRLEAACRQVVADGGRALGKAIVANLPTALFLVLPLMAGVMKLLYWRPRRYYVEHLLLLVHNQAFVYLFMSAVLVVLELTGDSLAGDLVTFGALGCTAWYFHRSMRVVYGQSRRLTLAKEAVLYVAYVVSSGVVVTITVLYSILTL